MAKATLVTPPPAPKPPPEVQLTLTKYEAETLLAICGWIGGAPSGRRGAIDRIADALGSVRYKGRQAILPAKAPITGDLYFED